MGETVKRTIARRLPAWLAMMLGVVLVGIGALATPAQAAPVVWQGQLKSWVYGKCLSANYNNDVYITPCVAGTTFHIWRLLSDGQLVNYGTGNCLSSNPNGTVYTVAATTCASHLTYHQWAKPAGQATPSQWKNKTTALCLSTNNTSVYGTSCLTDHDTQFWTQVVP